MGAEPGEAGLVSAQRHNAAGQQEVPTHRASTVPRFSGGGAAPAGWASGPACGCWPPRSHRGPCPRGEIVPWDLCLVDEVRWALGACCRARSLGSQEDPAWPRAGVGSQVSTALQPGPPPRPFPTVLFTRGPFRFSQSFHIEDPGQSFSSADGKWEN